MFIDERFISKLVKTYGPHPVSTVDGITWYPLQACRFLKLNHHLHSPFEKSILIERTMRNISRIEPNNALMAIFHTKEKRNAN